LKHLRDGTPDIAKAFGRTARTNLATGEPDRDAAQRPITNQPPSVHLFTKQGNLPGIEAWTNIFDADPAGATPLRTSWGDRNEATWLYRLTKPAHPARRDFVHVAWLDERFTVSLPLPWKALGGQRQVPVQVMVRMHPLERNVQLGVIVEDPDFAPMAGLMTASTLPKATVAVRQAREMLFGKELHPLGAAAGGYVLLAAGDSKESNWHSWIDNLADLFPNIPDGMILKASLRLRFPKSRDSADEARAALLEAFGRGIPYYAAGISWLLDGLTVFSDDPSVEEKMRVVQRVALRLDLSQAFYRYQDQRQGETMSIFRIDMLPGREGDCLWIEYGDAARPRRILIDGGRKLAWQTLKQRFAALPADQRKFELLMLSHVDADHIEGLLAVATALIL
jgi:hypothetical protein